MIKKLIVFLQGLWVKKPQSPIIMENLSSLDTSSVDLDILSNSLDIAPNYINTKVYLFNSFKNSLEKVNISFNYDLVDIISISPWGIIGLNSSYELVSLKLVKKGFYLMNTPDFPLEVFINHLPFTWEKNKPVEDSKDFREIDVNVQIEFIKEKALKSPVFNENYLNQNKKYFNEKEFQNLFLEVLSHPVESLDQSLDIFNQHLKISESRIFGHRWSLNSNYYYSESKLAALDVSELTNHQEWTNHNSWDNGQIAIIIDSTIAHPLLIEVVAVGPDYIWAINRQLACNLLSNKESKETCLLKAQLKISVKNIKKSYLIKN